MFRFIILLTSISLTPVTWSKPRASECDLYPQSAQPAANLKAFTNALLEATRALLHLRDAANTLSLLAAL
jgi:hypothetical protein